MGSSKRDGFYKRGKIWWTRDPVTKQRCSTHSTDLEAARRWRIARERIAADPAHAAAQTAQLGEWVGRWLAMKQQTAAAATMQVARQKLGHWVRLVGAETPLATISATAVDQYVATRRTEDVTDHTISKEVTHLLAVLKLAKRGGCYAGDLTTLRPPDLHAGYVPRKRALTRAELAALLAELEPRRGALVAVCVALGCRLSEAMRLLPTDFGPEGVTIRGTKTDEAHRVVPILSLYEPLLERALPYLPCEPWGKVQRDLGGACRRARIPRCSPNDLRRTHSTLLIEAGVDRDVVRRLLGHTSTAMVDRVYGQPKPEALGALAEERLVLAAPLTERYTDVTIIEESGSADDEYSPEQAEAPVAQWIEQRFPKPTTLTEEASPNSASSGFLRGRTRRNVARRPHVRGVASTSTSQSVSPAAWALAYAAQSLGVVR